VEERSGGSVKLVRARMKYFAGRERNGHVIEQLMGGFTLDVFLGLFFDVFLVKTELQHR
jgi:hypothetical protein